MDPPLAPEERGHFQGKKSFLPSLGTGTDLPRIFQKVPARLSALDKPDYHNGEILSRV